MIPAWRWNDVKSNCIMQSSFAHSAVKFQPLAHVQNVTICTRHWTRFRAAILNNLCLGVLCCMNYTNRTLSNHIFPAAILDFSALRKMPGWKRYFSETPSYPLHFGICFQISPRNSHGTRFMYLWLPDFLPRLLS